MNYRHAFHAGNHTEIFKHAALTLVLEHLRQKPKPFAVLDTHAGLGAYDLAATEAQRTGEAAGGFFRVFGKPLASAPAYAAALAEANPDGPRVYPGSPDLVRRAMRPGDRLVCCELHPDDAAVLRSRYRTDPRVEVHHRDGYEAMTALLPPPEKRGLVFVDPPYERRDETERVVGAVGRTLERWRGAVIVIWYPVKDRTIPDAFAAAAREWPAALVAELLPFQSDGTRLAGGGLLIVNAPYRIDAQLAAVADEVGPLLSDNATSRIAWLTPP